MICQIYLQVFLRNFYRIIIMHKVRLLVLSCKLIGESLCLHSTLNLTNKLAKGKDIKKTLNIFILFCFNHT
jgi:hypothetical protein